MFVIFALPRSRTYWMSRWLSRVAKQRVAHDLAIESDTIDGFLETLTRRVCGTVETGAVEAWPILRRAIPACRIAVVRRPLEQVAASLTACDFPVLMEDLERRAAALDCLAKQPGVLALEYADLSSELSCAALQEHCLAQPFDQLMWGAFKQTRLEVDLEARRARLAERGPALARLKEELAARLVSPVPFVTVGEERWSDIADAVLAMAAEHHVEATQEIEGRFHLNREALAAMEAAGIWRCFLARVDGAIAGYCSWTRDVSVEADMPPTMRHGPFYVAPEHRRHRLGRRLLAVSRATFAAEGIEVLRLHHTMHGRGVRAGRLYERLGAVEYQREYLWRIRSA